MGSGRDDNFAISRGTMVAEESEEIYGHKGFDKENSGSADCMARGAVCPYSPACVQEVNERCHL